MKKLLLISILIFAIALVGCEKKEEEPKTNEEVVVVKNNENEKELLTFEDRTKEARTWMNQGDKYGIEELGHVSLEHFVSKASMEKKDD